MADDGVTYQEQLMQLRQERQQREAAERVKQLTDEWKVVAEFRDDAALEGNLEAFESNDKDCEEIERELAKLAPPPQPSYVTAENASYVARFGDLDNAVNRAKFDQFVMTAERAGLNLADHAQFREGIEKFLSPGVFHQGRLVEGTQGPIVPVGAEPMPTRDEIFQTINATSKYGVKGEDFVKGERELNRRKNLGYYEKP